jgi:hypothetical protein
MKDKKEKKSKIDRQLSKQQVKSAKYSAKLKETLAKLEDYIKEIAKKS